MCSEPFSKELNSFRVLPMTLHGLTRSNNNIIGLCLPAAANGCTVRPGPQWLVQSCYASDCGLKDCSTSSLAGTCTFPCELSQFELLCLQAKLYWVTNSVPLGWHPEELTAGSQSDMCTPAFTEAGLTVAKQPHASWQMNGQTKHGIYI